MSLADSAIRLRRTRWGDRADLLAEELYTIFLGQTDPTTGPITVNMGDGTTPTQLPPNATTTPLGDFVFPDLNVPPIQLPTLQTQPSQDQTAGPGNEPGKPNFLQFDRKTTTRQHQRAVVPGAVIAGTGPYTMALFPNGPDGGGMNVNGAVELNGATVDVGTYALVFRHVAFDVIITETVVQGPGIEGEKVTSTKTEIKVVETDHSFVSGGGGTSAYPAQITGGGPGNNYTADVYLNGTGKPATSSSITQLDIDPAETIPIGTWLIVAKVGGVYYGQVPVWL